MGLDSRTNASRLSARNLEGWKHKEDLSLTGKGVAMKKRKTSGKLGVSRRDFLRNAGAGLMAAELAGASPGKQ